MMERDVLAGPEPGRPSLRPSDAPQSDTERRLIEQGQVKAERDMAELREHGFGHHIGVED